MADGEGRVKRNEMGDGRLLSKWPLTKFRLIVAKLKKHLRAGSLPRVTVWATVRCVHPFFS